jgi:ElaB/YqjD/DUF883 family membrane-anchored ribosome-binding protein
MAHTANEAGHEGLVEQATSQMQSATSTAQEKAGELKEQGKSRLSEQLDRRTTDVGSQARSLADVLRQGSETLREQGKPQPAGLTENVAERMERLGGYLEQASGDDILRDVERFARRQPWVIAGVGLLAGLAASRFVKASSERRYESVIGSGSRLRPYGSHDPDGAYAARQTDAQHLGSLRVTDEPITRENVRSG